LEWPLCNIKLFLEAKPGRIGSQVGLAICFYATHKTPLSEVISRDWVVLAPGHSYGGIVTMDPTEFPAIRKPGRYRVLATYSSGGVVGGYNGRVFAEPAEVERLPAREWKGQIESHSVPFRVRSSKKWACPVPSIRNTP